MLENVWINKMVTLMNRISVEFTHWFTSLYVHFRSFRTRYHPTPSSTSKANGKRPFTRRKPLKDSPSGSGFLGTRWNTYSTHLYLTVMLSANRKMANTAICSCTTFSNAYYASLRRSFVSIYYSFRFFVGFIFWTCTPVISEEFLDVQPQRNMNFSIVFSDTNLLFYTNSNASSS